MAGESVRLPWMATRRTAAFALRPHAYVYAGASVHPTSAAPGGLGPGRRTLPDRDTAQ